jgi:hypothetical protein
LAGALAIVAVATASLTFADAASIRPSHNPANSPRLLNKPIEGFRYDWGTGCKPANRIPSGMHALQRWLTRKVPRGESWGIHNCHVLPGGHWSLHSDNRAIDWHLDVTNPKDRREAYNLIHTLLAKDDKGNYAALARRMGIQGFIYNCHFWWARNPSAGMQRYSYCYNSHGHMRHGLNPTLAHMDHVHIELNLPGAHKQTSFWDSPAANR